MPARKIPLRISWPEGAGKHEVSFPVYCGLSLPKGEVAAVEQVGLVDGEGKSVVVGVERLARWTPDHSCRWLGLHFLARRGVEYFAVVTKEKQPRGAGVKIDVQPRAIWIDSGAAKFSLNKRGPLFGQVLIDGKMVVFQEEHPCLLLTDHQERTASESGGGDDEAPRIEVDGGQFVVVRREGFLRTARDEKLAKYVVRLEFQAGSATVKMQHSLIHTESTNATQYADLAVRLMPVAAAVKTWNAAFEPSPGADPATINIAAGKDDSAYLLQADFPHHGQHRSRRELKLRRDGENEFQDFATPSVTKEGSVADGAAARAGNWASVATEHGGAMIVVPKLAELFPKELEVHGERGLVAHLWSSRGGRLLDYRAAQLVDHWGVGWVDKRFPGGSAAMRKLDTEGQGSARTHDLWLHFFAPNPSGDQRTEIEIARLASTPPLAVQDPAWLRQTEALGYLHPHDPQRFPALEKFLRGVVEDYLVGAEQRWGDYGFLDYGCGAHTYDQYGELPGNALPRLNYRYADQLYHAQTALWQAYARSGDRIYHDYTHAHHRHLADFKFAHAERRNRPLGSRVALNGSEDNPYYWVGVEGAFGAGIVNCHQGFDPEGFLLHRYLTGDRWSEDAIVRSGEVFLHRFDWKVLPEIGASSDGAQPFLLAAALYQHTGDERYRQRLDEIRSRMIRLDTATGWADPNYFGAWEKYGIKIFGALADWRATESPVTRRALVEKAFPIWLWNVPPTDFGYHDHSGVFASHAWRMTGDVRYAELIDERFNRVLFEYVDADGRRRNVSAIRGGPHRGGNHAFNFLETAYYGMDLLVQTEGKRGPYVAVDTGPKCHPVEIHFAKDRHEPLAFQLRFDTGYDLQVTSHVEGYGRPSRDFDVGPVHWDAYPNYFTKDAPGFGAGFAKLTMGAETVEGEYRFTNVPLIFKHNARRMVTVVRDGIVLRAIHARPPTWHFQIPANKSGEFFCSKPVTLTIGSRTLLPTPGEWTTLTGGETDQMVSLTTSGLVFVNFRGAIPPVLAQHDAKLYFVPKQIQNEMPRREADAQQLAAQRAADQAAAKDATATFVRGMAGQSLRLREPHVLRIPRGEKVAERQHQFIHYDEGTLEFWFQPSWSTGGVARDGSLNFLSGGFWPCSIKHYGGDDEDPRAAGNFMLHADCTIAPPPGSPFRFPYQQLLNVNPVREAQWHHFAVSWKTDPQRGWLSEIYLDGRPSLGWARHDVGLGRFLESEPAKLYPAKPWPIDAPRGDQILLTGASLNANVDEFRICRTALYPSPFPSLPKRKFDHDDDTLLLLRFDGDLSSTSAPNTVGPWATVGR